MIFENFVFSLFNKEIQNPIMRDLILISTGVIPSSAYIIYMGVLFLRWVIRSRVVDNEARNFGMCDKN